MILKFTNKAFMIGVALLVAQATVVAQDVVEVDSTGTVSSAVITTVKDSVKTFKKFRVDGVAGVVGEYIVLDSDIDKKYIEIQSQGFSVEGVTRCQLLGTLLEEKLYAHHAVQDSIVVTNDQINGSVDQQIDYMVSQLGSEAKVAEYYKKDDISELRTELFEINKVNLMSSEMQRAVIEAVEITPEEVRTFYNSIPEEDRPVFGAELEVAQIIIKPDIPEEERQKVIDKLEEFRVGIVENGESFATKAVLYSQDPGSSSKGGKISLTKKDPFVKEFKEMAFSLQEGEVSEPFETIFGFHILIVDKIRGREVDVRHILLIPDVTTETVDFARAKIDTIRQRIINKELTFAEAAKSESDEEETKFDGGQLINPVTGDTRFDLTKMDPTLSAQVYNLKDGEVSSIFTDKDQTGRKKFKILIVTNRYEEHKASYAQDYERIKAIALKDKQKRVILDWQNEKIKETYVNINKEYYDCDFTSDWLKN